MNGNGSFPGEYKVVQVGWGVRTTGFENTGRTQVCSVSLPSILSIDRLHVHVKKLLDKACSHFRLEAAEGKYVLMVTIDGCELEASDDIVNYLPHMARATLKAVVTAEEGHSR